MSRSPRVVLDIQATQSVMHGSRGIARYVAEHAGAVCALAPDQVAALMLNPRYMSPRAADRFIGSGRLRWIDRRDPLLADEPLTYHAMSPFELAIPLEELWPEAVRRPECRLVVTLYDLIPLVFADRYLVDPDVRVRYMARLELIRSADLVLAISRCSGRDAVRLLDIEPDRVRVIEAGVSDHFRPPARPRAQIEAELERVLPRLRPGFFLYTGGVDFRKNMEGLVRAHAALPAPVRRAHQLVIACSMTPGYAEHLQALTAGEDDLLLTDYVPDEVLRGLYQATELFVFPSLYEGFGLPIAEAVNCGAPVVASNVSSLPEVAPSPEGLVDPDAPGALTEAMERAACDPSYLERLRVASAEAAGRHTWRAVAEASLAAYRELRARPLPARARPARIALVSPYPPDISGIAYYTRLLMEELAAHCEVECFVEGDPADYEPPPCPGASVHRIQSLLGRHHLVGYDLVLHCIGNNPLHRYVLEAMRHVPGDALCHDVRLVRFYASGGGGYKRGLADALREMYGGRLPADPEAIDWREAERLGAWMLGDVIALAERVHVHSRFAREVVELEARGMGAPADVRRLPFGFPAAVEHPRGPRHDPLVASFGLVDPVKCLDEVIEAMALVIERHPGARLVLVGPATAEIARDVRRAALAAGLAGRVQMTGIVSERAYARWLGAASVAVQLRAFSQGEASATVAEALAHGLPTIVTGAGWMDELPRDAVRRVSQGAGPAEIAAAICELLEDPAAAAALAAAGQRHAHEQSMRATARALLEVAAESRRRRAAAPPRPAACG